MKLLKFAENLQRELVEQGLMQKDLASYLGTTQQTISRWLKGINEPDLSTLLEICLHLNISPNEILGYDEITEEDFTAYLQDHDTVEEARKRQGRGRTRTEHYGAIT